MRDINQWKIFKGWLGLVALSLLLPIHCRDQHRTELWKENSQEPSLGVKLFVHDQHVELDNGIVNIGLSTPGGLITKVAYNGSDNLLDIGNKEDNRGYWDVIWNKGAPLSMDKLLGTSYKVVKSTPYQTEISFTRTWNVSVNEQYAPLNVDRRFVMLRDSPGFYTYAILERLEGWPRNGIGEARIVLKLRRDKFHYMAMSDERQRIMPMPEDRVTGKVLDYKEAVLLTNPTNPDLKGEVDDKYFYSCDNKDNRVHGWVSTDPLVGFWMITPSNEFRTGGPFKQDLTSHVGPILLSMFVSGHYAGKDLGVHFDEGEPWKKVFGPVFVYLNSYPSAKNNPIILWEDAKKQMLKEVASWPYDFPCSKDFIKANQRGTIRGQLFVYDWYINNQFVPASNAYVRLAPPGPGGSWQRESKGYQFWIQADFKGNFVINNVIPGTYSLYASIPGTIGDYKYSPNLTVNPGCDIKLDNLVYKPPRNGATLWEIGVPDRTAAEFFIPNPTPSVKIHNYKSPTEKFRQYGLWRRYGDLYPQNDLVFTIGSSNYTKDWFFAHVNKKVGNGPFQATTWRILFDLKNVNKAANYTLRLALASANGAELQLGENSYNINCQDPDLDNYKSPTEKFRQYGLWRRYGDLYPQNDLVFTIGSSNYTKDWFFAHVNKKVGNGPFQATTWRILFDLKNVNKAANYTLRLALASANGAELQVRFNDPRADPPHMTTGKIGNDNAVARHGIHGLYWLFDVSIAGSLLINGNNTIFLKQSIDSGPFNGIMYDYIRFEEPPGKH